MANLFLLAFAWHLFADFFLQDDYQAKYKTSLLHPASWLHAGLHFGDYLCIFPRPVALVIGITHLLIDTRVPLTYWRKGYGQITHARTPEEVPLFTCFAMLQDQSAHIIILVLAAAFCGK